MIDFTEPGRMIAPSKSGYLANHKRRECVVFNANICTKANGKIWWGDLDLSVDAGDLTAFARQQGETLYVLREKDALGDAPPAFAAAVATISKDGAMELCEPE